MVDTSNHAKLCFSQCHGGPVRNEETVDRIFAGDLDGLPNLSSRVKTVMVMDFPFTWFAWNETEILTGCADLHKFHIH